MWHIPREICGKIGALHPILWRVTVSPSGIADVRPQSLGTATSRRACVNISPFIFISFQFCCKGITQGLAAALSAFYENTPRKRKKLRWPKFQEVAQSWEAPLDLCLPVFVPNGTVAEFVTRIFCWWHSKDVSQWEHASCHSGMCITSKPYSKCQKPRTSVPSTGGVKALNY